MKAGSFQISLLGNGAWQGEMSQKQQSGALRDTSRKQSQKRKGLNKTKLKEHSNL